MQRSCRDSLPVVQVHVAATKFQPMGSSMMKPLGAYFRSHPDLNATATAAVSAMPPTDNAETPASPQPRALDTALPQVLGPGDGPHARRTDAGDTHPDFRHGHAALGAHADVSGPGRPGAQRTTACGLAGTNGSKEGVGINDGGCREASGPHKVVMGDAAGEAAQINGNARVERAAVATAGPLTAGVRLPEAQAAPPNGSGGPSPVSAAASAALAVGAATAAASAAPSPPAGITSVSSEAGAGTCGAAVGPAEYASALEVTCAEPAPAVIGVGSGSGDACALGAGARRGRGASADAEVPGAKRMQAGACDGATQEGGGASPAAGRAGNGAHGGCPSDAVPIDVGFESVLGWWECGALDPEGAASISRAVMQGLARARSR